MSVLVTHNISVGNDYDMLLYTEIISYMPLLLLFFTVIGFFGNFMVCLAIKLDTRLQNSTNFYLFSLAIVDMLVSIIVMPLAAFQIFYSNLIFPFNLNLRITKNNFI